MKLTYKYKEVIDTCDEYLADEECGWFRDKLFTNKTLCFYILGKGPYSYEKRFRRDSTVYLKIADSTLALIDSIIRDENVNCSSKFDDFNRMRFEYYGGFDKIKSELYDGKNPLYKEKEFAFISPQYFYGNNQWVGIEFSAGVFQRKTKMKYIHSSPMYSFNILTIGFRKNISTNKGGGMNLSLYSGSYNWINLNVINFTYLSNGEIDSWGYTPEIGVQFWYLHLNAGYNLAFKNPMRNYEKIYFTAKFDIPFYRF